MNPTLYTFGYEGLAIDSFVSRLLDTGVRLVIDVRAVPLSRKRGFSKTALSNELDAVGIRYLHFPAMGCPKSIRDRYKIDGDWRVYTKAFLAYLDGQSHAVSELATAASKTTACLICFEADFNRCHRIYVGRAAEKVGGLRLIHLTGRTMIPDAVTQVAA